MSARDRLADENPDALWPDGFDRAFVGIARRPGQPSLAAFSVAKAILLLVERDGMSAEQAEEYLAFNVVHAWMGPGTPVWIDDLEDEEDGAEDDDGFLGPEDLPSGQESPCPAPATTTLTVTPGAIPPGTDASTRASTALAGSTSSASGSGISSRP